MTDTMTPEQRHRGIMYINAKTLEVYGTTKQRRGDAVAV